MKKFLSLSLAVLMILSMVLVTASCADDPVQLEETTTTGGSDETTTANPDGGEDAPLPDDMTALQGVNLVVVARTAGVYAARGDESAKMILTEGTIVTAEGEDAEWYLVKNEHGDTGFIAKSDVADAAVLDTFQPVAEEEWEVIMAAAVRSYPVMNANVAMARGVLSAGATMIRLAANDEWSLVRVTVTLDGEEVTGEYYVMTSAIARVGGSTNPDGDADGTTTTVPSTGGNDNPSDDATTTTAPSTGDDDNPPDDGGNTGNQTLVTDIRLSAAFDALNGKAWPNSAFAANMSYVRGSGASKTATLSLVKLDPSCRLYLTGWALLNGGQNGLYWSVDGKNWTAFVGGQYSAAEDDVLTSATNSSGTYLGGLTDAKAEKGRFANVMANLSAYDGQAVDLTVAVANPDGTKLVKILVINDLCVNCEAPEEETTTAGSGGGAIDPNHPDKPGYVDGPVDVTTINKASQTNVRSMAAFDVVGGQSWLSGNQTIHNTEKSIHIIATHPGLTLGEDGKLNLYGWALLNGGQSGMYWSLDKNTWYSFTGGCYFDAESAALDAAKSTAGASMAADKAKAAKGRFADLTADLSAYAGQTLTVYVAGYNGLMVHLLTLNSVYIPAEDVKEEIGLDVNKSDLDELMDYVFAGGTMKNETVMFLDKGDTKKLLFPASSVTSVTNYDGTVTYQAGRDYVLNTDGTITFPATTTIPCITSSVYYNYTGPTTVQGMYNGNDAALTVTTPNGNKKVWWGEGPLMTYWQVNVNYTTGSDWTGYVQNSNLHIYQDFVKKLIAGEDVTVVFYGDSITYGASASSLYNYAPYQDPYAILFTKALADLFDYTVEYVNPNMNLPTNSSAINGSSMPTAPVPSEDYVAGTRGTITYVNTAIGGWKSVDGKNLFDQALKPFLQTHGCDLFVIGFGMNDGTEDPTTYTKANVKATVDQVLAITPDTDVVLVSTMVANNKSVGWYANSIGREAPLQTLASEYRAAGVNCAVSCMTSTSEAVLTRKDFHDYSGNNINHPNDYFARIYAQTLLQCVIGYENMN